MARLGFKLVTQLRLLRLIYDTGTDLATKNVYQREYTVLHTLTVVRELGEGINHERETPTYNVMVM
jgi:hypothetical protein